ncbi:hypothetical protein Pint_36614 [Pistacia integerrima]|uniref:Uncharacterized protein n=1 Tax=Pistacia integerrima TaxID=434235 RepID=A0ACC0XYZ4_9ROSI|nr:hypothetical protein Pint_36614 [Pistacia integerrima]
MVARGVKPDAITYEILIDVHCKKDNLIEAFKLQEELLGKGLLSKGTAYDSLIDAVCKKGDLSKAVGLLDEMRQQGIKPSFGTCSTVVCGLHEGGKIDEATGVLGNLKNHGWVSDDTSLSELVTRHLIDQNAVDTSINNASLGSDLGLRTAEGNHKLFAILYQLARPAKVPTPVLIVAGSGESQALQIFALCQR